MINSTALYLHSEQRATSDKLGVLLAALILGYGCSKQTHDYTPDPIYEFEPLCRLYSGGAIAPDQHLYTVMYAPDKYLRPGVHRAHYVLENRAPEAVRDAQCRFSFTEVVA